MQRAISPFGGLWGLIKFLDIIDFKKHFEEAYIAPSRETKLGDYAMVLGILGLMFIGFIDGFIDVLTYKTNFIISHN
jgi:hypothetical protein